MKAYERTARFILAFSSFLIITLGIVASPADATLVWNAQVFAIGPEVVSSQLVSGVQYRIVAQENWWYNYPNNLAADAQYYTTDPTNSIFWGNHYPAPGGGSFLQINGQNVTWGPFSNGETNHTYRIHVLGQGLPLTFRIVDLMDGNYDNDFCHIHVSIYEEIPVGGHTVDYTPGQLATCFTISALILALVATFPIIKHHKKA